jgi:hypothetical protein
MWKISRRTVFPASAGCGLVERRRVACRAIALERAPRREQDELSVARNVRVKQYVAFIAVGERWVVMLQQLSCWQPHFRNFQKRADKSHNSVT